MRNELKYIEDRFDRIITTDGDGELNLPYTLATYSEGSKETFARMEAIIEVKGYFRGSTKTKGKWMRKEELVLFMRENPTWVGNTMVAKKFGI
jgi:hypothetical protein